MASMALDSILKQDINGNSMAWFNMVGILMGKSMGGSRKDPISLAFNAGRSKIMRDIAGSSHGWKYYGWFFMVGILMGKSMG